MERKIIIGLVLSSLLVLLQGKSPAAASVHLTNEAAQRIALGQYVPREKSQNRIKRQAIVNAQLYQPLVKPKLAANALETPFPTTIGFFPDIPGRLLSDKCKRDQIEMVDGSCQYLMAQGNCNKTQEIVLDYDSGKGICAERLCPLDKIFVHSTQLCHDPHDTSVCPAGRELYYSSYGTSVCACPDGTIETDDDLDDDVCEALLTPSMSCNVSMPRTVLWLKNFNSTPQCLQDPCGGINLNKFQTNLPHLPSISGTCNIWGSSDGACPSNKHYALDLENVKGECSELEEAGYEVFDPDTVKFAIEKYGPLSEPKSAPSISTSNSPTTTNSGHGLGIEKKVEIEQSLAKGTGQPAVGAVEPGVEMETSNVINNNFPEQVDIEDKKQHVGFPFDQPGGSGFSFSRTSSVPDSQSISVSMQISKVGQDFQVDKLIQNGHRNDGNPHTKSASPLHENNSNSHQISQGFNGNNPPHNSDRISQNNVHSINDQHLSTFQQSGFTNTGSFNTHSQNSHQTETNGMLFPQSHSTQFNSVPHPQQVPHNQFQPSNGQFSQSFQPNQGFFTSNQFHRQNLHSSHNFNSNQVPHPSIQNDPSHSNPNTQKFPQSHNFASHSPIPHPQKIDPSTPIENQHSPQETGFQPSHTSNIQGIQTQHTQFQPQTPSHYPQRFPSNQGIPHGGTRPLSFHPNNIPQYLTPYPNQGFHQIQPQQNYGFQPPQRTNPNNQQLQSIEVFDPNAPISVEVVGQQTQSSQNHHGQPPIEPISFEVFSQPGHGAQTQPMSFEVFDQSPHGYNHLSRQNHHQQAQPISLEMFDQPSHQNHNFHQSRQQASFNSPEARSTFGMRIGRSLGVGEPVQAILKSYVTILPSGEKIVHKIPQPRRIRSIAEDDEGDRLSHSSLEEAIDTSEDVPRVKRSALPFASPSNVFETRLLGCRPGAVRDINAKCRNTILPARVPKRRGIRASPPVPPSPSCPSGFARDIRRQCVPRTTARRSIFAKNLG